MSSGQQPLATPIEFQGDESDPSYMAERLAWRKSLTDTDVRALAYEYKVGNYDECSTDAWAEYQERFGDRANGPQKEFTQKRRKRTASQSRKRRSKGA